MSKYKNGTGNVPRLPERVVDTLIDSAGVSRCAPGRGNTVIDQTAAVEQLVHDAAEELLARLPASPLASFPLDAYQDAPDNQVIFGSGSWALTVGDVRAARAAQLED